MYRTGRRHQRWIPLPTNLAGRPDDRCGPAPAQCFELGLEGHRRRVRSIIRAPIDSQGSKGPPGWAPYFGTRAAHGNDADDDAERPGEPIRDLALGVLRSRRTGRQWGGEPAVVPGPHPLSPAVRDASIVAPALAGPLRFGASILLRYHGHAGPTRAQQCRDE